MYMFRASISFYDVAIQFRSHVMVKSNSLKGVYKFCNTKCILHVFYSIFTSILTRIGI